MKTTRQYMTPRQAAALDKSRAIYRNRLLKLNLSILDNNDMFIVKGGRPLINILKGMFIVAGAGITNGRIRMICMFLRDANAIQRAQGVKGLVLFLKTCNTSIQQSIGGMKVKDTGQLGSRIARTRKGLPRSLPCQIRLEIAKGSALTVKLALTMYNLYRVLEFPGKLKLHTISEPNTGHGGLNRMIYSYIPLFVKLFVRPRFSLDFLYARLAEFSRESLFSIFKGGPGVQGSFGEWNTMPYILLRSLRALMNHHKLWDSVITLFDYMPSDKVQWAIKQSTPSWEIKCLGEPLVKPLPYLGKLGLKQEAAGKIRVFAMVDAWTQWILYPLHKVIFMILEGIKMDGTFDQLAPLEYLLKSKSLYSLDLTAATDRIPLALQRELLGHVLSFQFAGAWANLLVARTYRLHETEGTVKSRLKVTDLKYAVGQPMGALSSWAMLALVHHLIVQIAAWRAGQSKDRLYTNYAILGDDLVIGDHAVMRQYLMILESLGVQCGLHKSLISPKGLALEFAKRTFFKGVDVSPVPLLEFEAGNKSLGAFKEIVTKYKLSTAKALQAYGVGWKVRSWLNRPIGKLSSRIRLVILSLNVPTDEESATKFFELGAPLNPLHTNDVRLIMDEFARLEVSKLKTKLLIHSNEAIKQDNVTWARETAAGVVLNQMGLNMFPPSEGMNVPELLDLIKSGQVAKSDVQYPFRLLADALANLSNGTWHAAKLEAVADCSRIIKVLWELPNQSFEAMYMGYLKANREVASLNALAFSKVRPNPPAERGIVDSVQIRLWRRWSKVLQGTQKVTSTK